MAKFLSSNKKLYYLAGMHENYLGSPTHQFIDYAFDTLKPTAVIIEGIEPGDINHVYKKMAIPCAIHDFKNCPETLYALFYARKNNFEIFTGEPEEKTILSYIKTKGFDFNDYLGFYILRQIPQWKRENRLNHNIEDLVNDFIELFKKDLGNESLNFNYKSFINWYFIKNNQEFELQKITARDTSPQKPGFMLNLWQAIEKIREITILATIENSFKEHDKVFIIYGGSHFSVEASALTKAFGHPTYVLAPEKET